MCKINNQSSKNHANATLNQIIYLKNNWNGNGAKQFSPQLIEKCRQLLNILLFEPFVAPTACESIQFEFEKGNGDYLEFEIFEDRIEVYKEISSHTHEEYCLGGAIPKNEIRRIVKDFYKS